MTILAALVLTFLAFCGLPLFIVISGAALLAFHALEVDLSIVIIEMYRLAANPLLIALLLFAFAGYVLAEGKSSHRLVRLSRAILGRMPGGLAVIALFCCAFFTSLTGASGVTIVALGGILLPALLKENYTENFSLGLLTTSGSLGLLFPPSLPLIIYGVVSGVSISQLFLAGILPGMLMIGVLSLYSVYKGHGIERQKDSTFSVHEVTTALRNAVWEVLLPVVVLGGIFSGVFVLSEAAAVTALYVLIVEMAIHRELGFKDLAPIITKTVMMVGGIMLILGASLAFNAFLIDQQIPNRALAFIQEQVTSKFAFLLILNLFLLAVGCVLDVFSALVIVVPLIMPMAAGYDIHPVHLGIIFLTNLQIGYSTPPIGMNLFIAALRFERPMLQLYRASMPFLLLLLVCLALITFVPFLSLIRL